MYLSINDIRKKSTNKSKVEINVRKKKIWYSKDTAPYNNETWFTTWLSKFETETETCDICTIWNSLVFDNHRLNSVERHNRPVFFSSDKQNNYVEQIGCFIGWHRNTSEPIFNFGFNHFLSIILVSQFFIRNFSGWSLGGRNMH